MKRAFSVTLLLLLSACCTLGPNDKPDGVMGYIDDCKAVMQGKH
jgi:hypothetical protein